MKKLLFIFSLLLLTSYAHAQYVYQIRADSVRIYNVCDTAELIIENRTRGVEGFLFNKGNGRTEFRRIKLEVIGGNQVAITGQDTLDLNRLSGVGGIDTLYRRGDSLVYTKKGLVYARYAPLPPFVVIPSGTTKTPRDFHEDQVTGFSAYGSPDMPFPSDQALANGGPENGYVVGHTVLHDSAGYQMAVNWDGELTGPKGVFIRNKDDTKTTWGAWRELMFKDYADNKYYSILNLQTSGQARVHWDNIINTPDFNAMMPGLQTVTEKGNTTTRPIEVSNKVSAIKDNALTADLYSNSNFEANGNFPAYGFRRSAGEGVALYFNGGNNIRIRNNYNADGVIWSSLNHGTASGLDADKVDGMETSSSPLEPNTLAARDNEAKIAASQFVTTTATETGDFTKIFGSYDNRIRAFDASALRRFVGVAAQGENLQSVTDRGNTTNKEIQADGFLINDASISLKRGSLNSLRIKSPNGHLDIGVTDDTWCDLETDRPKFYINHEVHFEGAMKRYNTTGFFDGYNLGLVGGNGNGIKFSDNDGKNGIWMSGGWDGTFGGRVKDLGDNETNMYFKASDKNNGFVFIPGNGTPVVQIENNGIFNNGWYRSMGNTGWMSQEHGGGWYMLDDIWIRSFGGKSILQNEGILRTDGNLQVGLDGATMNVPANGVPTINTHPIWHSGNLTPSEDAVAGTVALRDANANINANGFYQRSLAALKKDIHDFDESGLSLINSVQVKEFVYKNDTEDNVHIGIIADSSDWHFATKKQDRFDTNSSLAVAMKAIQELSAEVDVLKQQNSTLQTQMEAILKRLEKLENKKK